MKEFGSYKIRLKKNHCCISRVDYLFIYFCKEPDSKYFRICGLRDKTEAIREVLKRENKFLHILINEIENFVYKH